MVLVGNSLVFSEAVESAEENEAWRRRGSKLGAPTLPKAVEWELPQVQVWHAYLLIAHELFLKNILRKQSVFLLPWSYSPK